jgi:hypothetical protein
MQITIRLAQIGYAHPTDDSLIADFDNGRTISVPLAWIRACCTAHRKNARIGG